MTYFIAPYDQNAPIPKHHWEMELSTICIVNSLTLITLVGRTVYRWTQLKRFRREDRWIVGSLLPLLILFVCQVGACMVGSGLRAVNVKDEWLKPHWIFSWGWIGYYLTISMIKVAICCCLLEFLPFHFKKLRRSIIALCVLIMSLAIAESFTWLIQCEPFASNFVYEVDSTSCINIDYPRYLWTGLSIPIDIAILSVPIQVVKRTGLQHHEKRVLRYVFTANLLGTIACCAGFYGTYENRQSEQVDVYYTETIFIMINDIEIFCYALGATIPIFSRFFISKSAPSRSSPSQGPKPSWLRTVTTSLKSPFTSTSQFDSPRSESRLGIHLGIHPSNLLPISETSTNNSNSKNDSPISDFITVPKKLEGSKIRISEQEMEIERHTPEPMITPHGFNSSIITPLYVSRSTSTRSKDFAAEERDTRGGGNTPSIISDLEGGYGYNAWVEGGRGKRDSRGSVGGGKAGLRSSSLYDWE